MSPSESSRRPESQRSDGSLSEFELPPKEYSNDFPIEEFIVDIASITRRPLDKANEWLLKLQAQDIMTVGDLRHLHEEDWSQLNLTVFACRAIRNALQAKPRPALSSLPNQSTIKSLARAAPTIPEDPQELLLSTSPVQESNIAAVSTMIVPSFTQPLS